MKKNARSGKYKKNKVNTVYLVLLVLLILFIGSYSITKVIARKLILFSGTSANSAGQAQPGQAKPWEKSVRIATRKPLFIGLEVPATATYRLVSDEARHEDWGIDITLSSGTKLNICTGCQQFIKDCPGISGETCTATFKTIGNTTFTEFRPKNDPKKVAGYSNSNPADPSMRIIPNNNLPLSQLEQQVLTWMLSTVKHYPRS